MDDGGVQDLGFFLARTPVGSEPKVALDNIIINCYRLAEKYHCDPNVFLAQPISHIGRHLYWTDRMNQFEDEESAWQDKLRNS